MSDQWKVQPVRQTERVLRPYIVIHGGTGLGKTQTATLWEDTAVISVQPGGCDDIRWADVFHVYSGLNLVSAVLNDLERGPGRGKYKNVVLDTVDDLHLLALAEVTASRDARQTYGRAFEKAAPLFSRFLRLPLVRWVTCGSRLREADDDETFTRGPAPHRDKEDRENLPQAWVPNVPPALLRLVKDPAHAIVFVRAGRLRQTGEVASLAYAQPHPAYLGKDRYGLLPTEPFILDNEFFQKLCPQLVRIDRRKLTVSGPAPETGPTDPWSEMGRQLQVSADGAKLLAGYLGFVDPATWDGLAHPARQALMTAMGHLYRVCQRAARDKLDMAKAKKILAHLHDIGYRPEGLRAVLEDPGKTAELVDLAAQALNGGG